MNKVGPYNNPQETYNYFSLPFCHPSENPTHKWGGLGEVLGGNELIDSQVDIKYRSKCSCLLEILQKFQTLSKAILYIIKKIMLILPFQKVLVKIHNIRPSIAYVLAICKRGQYIIRN